MRLLPLLFLLLLLPALPGRAAPAPAAGEPALAAALRQGGLVVFLRHTETGPAHPDSATAVPGDCATQRNLNAEGRAQAEAIGAAFRALGVPVGAVLASPFCRTVETAALAFGRALPEPALSLPRHLDPAAHAAMGQALRGLVAAAHGAPGVTVLVGHSYHLIAAGGPRPDPQGAAAVLRPRADGGFETLALLAPADWAGLAPTRIAETAR